MADQEVRSSLMQNHQDKVDDIRERMAGECLAFVQVRSSGKRVRGYVFACSRGDYRFVEDDEYMFKAFLVGNPSENVDDVEGAIASFRDETIDELNERDAYASVICEMLAQDHAALMKNRFHVPMQCVETLFLDDDGTVHWCGFNGAYDEVSVTPRTKRLLIRGCHDPAVKREVNRILRTFQALNRPNAKAAKNVIRKLKRATGATRADFYEVSR